MDIDESGNDHSKKFDPSRKSQESEFSESFQAIFDQIPAINEQIKGLKNLRHLQSPNCVQRAALSNGHHSEYVSSVETSNPGTLSHDSSSASGVRHGISPSSFVVNEDSSQGSPTRRGGKQLSRYKMESESSESEPSESKYESEDDSTEPVVSVSNSTLGTESTTMNSASFNFKLRCKFKAIFQGSSKNFEVSKSLPKSEGIVNTRESFEEKIPGELASSPKKSSGLTNGPSTTGMQFESTESRSSCKISPIKHTRTHLTQSPMEVEDSSQDVFLPKTQERFICESEIKDIFTRVYDYIGNVLKQYDNQSFEITEPNLLSRPVSQVNGQNFGHQEPAPEECQAYLQQDLLMDLWMLQKFANLTLKEYEKEKIDFEKMRDYIACFEVMKEERINKKNRFEDLRTLVILSKKLSQLREALKRTELLLQIVEDSFPYVQYGIFVIKIHEKLNKEVQNSIINIWQLEETATSYGAWFIPRKKSKKSVRQ